MPVNQRLAIAIPTYNRADFLDYSLEVHIPIMQAYSVPIYISDNASTDNTQSIVEKWQQVYPYIYYHRNDENLGPDKNFEFALKMPATDYVWLLGDTYQISHKSIEKVLSQLDDDFDSILVNVNEEVIDVVSQVYFDKDSLFNDLFWLMTCLSVHIYSSRLIQEASFNRYRETSFIQTCIVFEYINEVDFRISWNSDVGVSRVHMLDDNKKKTTWRENLFKIWYEDRVGAILSLPPQYSLKSKLKVILNDGSDRSSISIRTFFGYRSEGLLSISILDRFSYLLPFVTRVPKFVVYIIARTPFTIVKVMKFFYKLTKK